MPKEQPRHPNLALLRRHVQRLHSERGGLRDGARRSSSTFVTSAPPHLAVTKRTSGETRMCRRVYIGVGEGGSRVRGWLGAGASAPSIDKCGFGGASWFRLRWARGKHKESRVSWQKDQTTVRGIERKYLRGFSR